MKWIYLSPHLDDAALSLGGLLWEQSQAGEQVIVWTVCAGDPAPGPLSAFAESLHQRWETGETAMAARRAEDIQACEILGISYRHLPIPDCIYRTSAYTQEYLYTSENALFGELHPHEDILVQELSQTFRENIPSEARLVCPLGLGGHVDHRLTRAAAERLNVPLWYYADYPYLLDIGNWEPTNLEAIKHPISSAGLRAWQEAVAAHHSQISTFWQSVENMKAAILEYNLQVGGGRLWHNNRT